MGYGLLTRQVESPTRFNIADIETLDCRSSLLDVGLVRKSGVALGFDLFFLKPAVSESAGTAQTQAFAGAFRKLCMSLPFLVLISCSPPHAFEFICESGTFFVKPTASTHGRVRFDEQYVPYVSEPRIRWDVVDVPVRYVFDLDGHEAALWLSSQDVPDGEQRAALISSQKGKAVENCEIFILVN